MNFSEIASKVAQFGAPLLASLIGGGVPAVATQAVKLVMDSLNVQHPDELDNALNYDPQAAIKIQEIESNERIRLKELETQLQTDTQSIAERDRESARNREIQVRDKTPSQIAKIFIFGYFLIAVIIILAIWSHEVTKDELEPLIQLLKELGMAIMLILAYYFGASHKKD